MSTIEVLNQRIMEAKRNYNKFIPQKIPVWQYTRQDGMHSIDVFHVKNNIYLVENRGIAYQEGCSLAFDFIIDTVKHTGGKICCLLDNSKLASIDWSFKLLFLKFPLANECFAKIATIGDNLYVKSFARIYQYTFGRKFKIRSFPDKAVALDWLESA
jgi:hypothetical protein